MIVRAAASVIPSAGPGTLAAAFVALTIVAPAPTPAPPPVPLENTHWALVAVGGSAVNFGAAHGAFVLFRHGESGRFLGGTGGCNGLKGTYDTFVGRLRINASVLAGRPCPAPLAGRETKLVEALRTTANYRIEGNTLALLAADGRVLARFKTP